VKSSILWPFPRVPRVPRGSCLSGDQRAVSKTAWVIRFPHFASLPELEDDGGEIWEKEFPNRQISDIKSTSHFGAPQSF
jgi:hypothetical protein